MTDIKKLIEDLEYARYHCTSNKGKDAINDALDIINRQQAEFERLKAEEEKYPFKCVMPFNSMVCSKSIEDYDRLVGDIGADAIKEFAERLKKTGRIATTGHGVVGTVVDVWDIDNLVKEMVGEDETT